jgi:hypothetical protein
VEEGEEGDNLSKPEANLSDIYKFCFYRKESPCGFVAENVWLMLFKEVIAVYSENDTKLQNG